MDIVVGFDGSPASWRAFFMALGIAQRERASVHVSFVYHVPVPASAGALTLPPPGLVVGQGGGQLEQQATAELEVAGVEGAFTCLEGDIASELEALAERCRADLVVVGRSRHPALRLGGVPRKLLAMGHRPVLVVP
ncbi:MAG TPA: universal stress protein [Acidimicrobiales bacterium]|nr:universal stress protein [Acidimicrobiales bacterium]